MKLYYVYLNKYANGELYVGQHCSNTGAQDSYEGSSALAKLLKLKLVKQEVLEVCKDAVELSEREDYWIDYYCRNYGLHDAVLYKDNAKGEWGSKYQHHGRMLNCHDSGAQNLRRPGVHEKSVQTRKENGSYVMAASQLHTSQAVRKAVLTRKIKGVYDHCTDHFRNKECVQKAVKTRKLRGDYQTMGELLAVKNKDPEFIKLQQQGRRRKAKKYQLSGRINFIGTITDCAKVLGSNIPTFKKFINKDVQFKGCKIISMT